MCDADANNTAGNFHSVLMAQKTVIDWLIDWREHMGGYAEVDSWAIHYLLW